MPRDDLFSDILGDSLSKDAPRGEDCHWDGDEYEDEEGRENGYFFRILRSFPCRPIPNRFSDGRHEAAQERYAIVRFQATLSRGEGAFHGQVQVDAKERVQEE